MSGFRLFPAPREAGGGGGFTPAGEPLPPTPAPPLTPLSGNVPGTGTPLDPKDVTTGDSIFGRRWKLTLYPPPKPGAAQQQGQDFSDLHFTFSVTRTEWTAPTQLDCLIYNVNDDLINTANIQPIRPFSRIVLEAGYHRPSSRYGTIFDGEIFWYRRQRMNPTDIALRVVANVFDQAFTQALINTTLDAGSTPEQRVEACLTELKQYGVEGKKLSPELPEQKAERARTLYKPVMDGVLRDEKRSNQTGCSFDGKNIVMLRDKELLNPNAFVLNSQSGLVGVAQQELGRAFYVRSLLNPLIGPWTKIQINENDISTLTDPSKNPNALNALPQQKMELQKTARSRADGIYRAFSVTHHGDNRGTPWYSDIRTEPFDPTQKGPSLGGGG